MRFSSPLRRGDRFWVVVVITVVIVAVIGSLVVEVVLVVVEEVEGPFVLSNVPGWTLNYVDSESVI